jgi:hypothetical protein
MKVNIEYDSSTKKAVVKVDGKVVEDLDSVHISKRYSYDEEEEEDGPQYTCSINTVQDKREEDGVVKTSSIYAKNQNPLGGLLAAHRRRK